MNSRWVDAARKLPQVRKRWKTLEPEVVSLLMEPLARRGWELQTIGEAFAEYCWMKQGRDSTIFEFYVMPGASTDTEVHVSSMFTIFSEAIRTSLTDWTGRDRWPARYSLPPVTGATAFVMAVSPQWLRWNELQEDSARISLQAGSTHAGEACAKLLEDLDRFVDPLVEETTDIRGLARFLARVRDLPVRGGSGYRSDMPELYAAVLFHRLGDTLQGLQMLEKAVAAQRKRLERLGLPPHEINDMIAELDGVRRAFT